MGKARPKPTVVFTCCGGAGGWSLLRSLAAMGRYRLVGCDAEALVAALYQPELSGRHVIPFGHDPTYIDRILEICKSEKADVFWPCADEEILSCSAVAERFTAAGVHLIASPHATVMTATDKLATVALVEDLGVPVPCSWRLDDRVEDPPMPVIVRPIRARSGHGVVFFESVDELDAYRVALGNRAAGQMVQERLDYRLGRLYMAQAIYDSGGRRLAAFMSRSIQTAHDWGGPALGGVPVNEPRLAEFARTVMEATGPHYGAINVEFIYDAAREDFVFVEVNPRYWGYSFLATAAGINFPDIVIRMAMGENMTSTTEYRTDVVTLTSREQLAITRGDLLGELPNGGIDA